MRRVCAWAHGFLSESASGSEEAGELKEVAVTASCLREQRLRLSLSQCMGWEGSRAEH